jgi:Protein of unknown function (DUF3014)
VNDPKTSIQLPEKPEPGLSPVILAGILFFSAVVLYGVYLYVTGQLGPDIHLEESFSTTAIDRPSPKPETASSLAPEASEGIPIASDQEVPAQDVPDAVEPTAGLPPLDESDAFVRDALAGLSARQEYVHWIGMEHLIPNMTTVIDNVSRGSIPASRIKPLAPQEKFAVIEKEPDVYLIDPKGYHRYDVYADTFSSLDLPKVMQIYGTLKPLFDSAYAELGYPDGDFESVLRRAINHLLEVPVLPGEVALVRPSVMYKFADPELESLTPAQKQLIRMGPRNVRIVQSVLRKVLAQLGPAEPPEGSVSRNDYSMPK